MIPRRAQTAVQDALARQASIALTGPRQVGKTTLAHTIAAGTPSVYLDLEASEDRAKLADPAVLLSRYDDRLKGGCGQDCPPHKGDNVLSILYGWFSTVPHRSFELTNPQLG